jgi:hypothetical protein
MIETLHVEVIRQCDAIRLLDPHQLARPCWQWSTIQLLPPEYLDTRELNVMPVQIMQASSAPSPRIFREPSCPEVAEVIEYLKKAKPTDALKVTLSGETVQRFSGVSKKGKKFIPAKQVASALNRRFKVDGLAMYAYSPDGIFVFVMAEKEADKLRSR